MTVTFHSIIVLSFDPLEGLISLLFSIFHNFIFLSSDPLARIVPLKLNATDRTEEEFFDDIYITKFRNEKIPN